MLQSSLEGSGCVLEAEWHNEPFVVSLMRDESRFGDRVWFHGDLPVTPSNIESSEVLGAGEAVKDFVDSG